MVDQSGDIPMPTAIQIVLPVQLEYIDATVAAGSLSLQPLPFASACLRFRDPFATIFNDSRSIRDRNASVNSTAMNARFTRLNPRPGSRAPPVRRGTRAVNY